MTHIEKLRIWCKENDIQFVPATLSEPLENSRYDCLLIAADCTIDFHRVYEGSVAVRIPVKQSMTFSILCMEFVTVPTMMQLDFISKDSERICVQVFCKSAESFPNAPNKYNFISFE